MEVVAARSWGVPHSVLTGRAVRPGEPWFTAADTAYAVALTAVEARACPGCGLDRADTTAAGREFHYRAEAVRCHACAARSRAAEKYQTAGGSAHGLMFAVTPKEE